VGWMCRCVGDGSVDQLMSQRMDDGLMTGCMLE
jgi:hypothetical protein